MRKRIGMLCASILALALCAVGFAAENFGDLKRGDRGEGVRALQERLAYLGYYTKAIDGDFGPGMEDAVAAFNKTHGLTGGAATADMQAVAHSEGAIPFGERGAALKIGIDDIADGAYRATLPGDRYTTTTDADTYTITSTIDPAEITLTVRDGQIALYCAADAASDGTVFGVQAPRSPAYVQTISGTLPLRRIGETLVYAEGDLTAPSEGVSIYWENNRFARWAVEPRDNSYHCTVSITMKGGVPAAEVVARGSCTRRACTLTLARKA